MHNVGGFIPKNLSNNNRETASECKQKCKLCNRISRLCLIDKQLKTIWLTVPTFYRL